ncbi:glycosyltransferase family 2 protein [Parabacteroides sp. OttesenSCG-928-G07]|nr:glycosyltransferase family 2 protein [Parabacteroides sp. OttesenSCG-928-G21]MDL2278069.1 glycosyltransferase family 2 protein [Parabacteroides sp. OttesenSCG-928-G07]
MRHTIFTPTYNRIKTLPRVYESLKKQTYKEFIWLIIDDGSNDGTRELAEEWKKEAQLSINYFYKKNGGKHTAFQMALEIVTTKYITTIDSDDILLPNALEVLDKAWKKIEADNLENSIAQVQGFTIYETGELVGYGNFSLNPNILHIDASWHELVLKNKCLRELVGACNVEKLKECIDFNKYTWKKKHLRYLGESIFWSSIGRKYKTRLLNNIFRIYYLDGGDSLLRTKKNRDRYINEMVNCYYFIEENDFKFLFYYPYYYISQVAKFTIIGIHIGESFNSQFKIIKNKKFKYIYALSYPLAYIFHKCTHPKRILD